MPEQPKNKNPHKDHRLRMKRQFLRGGIDQFEAHQVLEMLLFYAIPQKDTNPLAHRLLDHFGDLASVLDADYGALCQVDGISEHTATLIVFCRELLSRYYKEKNTKREFESMREIVEFLQEQFVNERCEKVRLMLLNNRRRLLGCVTVHTGTMTASLADTQEMVKIALRYDTTAVVVAHNHPVGSCLPSRDDITATKQIAGAFRQLDIEVLDHLIFAEDRCYSMRSSPSYAPVFSGAVERIDNQAVQRV